MSKLHTKFSDFLNARAVQEAEDTEVSEPVALPEPEEAEESQSSKEAYMEKFKEKGNVRKDIQEYLDEVSCYSIVDLSVEDSFVRLELSKKEDCEEKESTSVVMERICKMLSCESWKFRPTEEAEYVYQFRF